jgi:membrane dipeptidase
MRRAILAIAVLWAGSAHAETDAELIARARAIHDRILTIDTHVDIPPNFGTEAYDLMKPGPRGQQVHLPTMLEGGLDATFLIVFVGQGVREPWGYAKALSDAFVKFAAIHKVADVTYRDKIALAYSAADVRRIHASGRKVALIGVENGYPIGKDLRLLDQFYDYGARYFGLLHIGHNDLGDSSVPEKRLNDPPEEHGGLSPLGKQVVRRLNQLGIMVDVSHSSTKSALDMAKVSTAPIIASHSGVKGVFDHPRNLSDAELEAIKKTGGVAQMVGFDSYLRAVPAEKTAAVAALWQEYGLKEPGELRKLSPEALAAYDRKMAEIELKWPRAGVKDLADHIDYAVRKVGIDTVGIASDFNGGGGIAGWNSAAETFNVTLELVRRGYTEAQIAKIWGGNLLRVMEKVEARAAKRRVRS